MSWQYRRIAVLTHKGAGWQDEGFEKKMAELDAEGWELLTVTDTNVASFLYVRRRSTPITPPEDLMEVRV